MPTKKLTTIAQYIAAAPKKSQEKLRQLHACIRSAAPGAKESLKWSMPAFSYHRIVLTFAAFDRHIGLYPTPEAIQHFAKDLSKYKTGKGSIQFPLDQPLPFALIRKIVKFRVSELMKKDARWM